MTSRTQTRGPWPAIQPKAAKKPAQTKMPESLPIDMIEPKKAAPKLQSRTGNRPPINIETLVVDWVDPPGLKAPIKHYYDKKFDAMEPGQSIVCDVVDVDRVRASMKSWLRRKGLPGKVRTYANHPKKGKGTVTWSQS